MAIRIECRCGTSLKVDDKLAGKQAKCPKCGERLPIPQGSERVDDHEVEPIRLTCQCGGRFVAKPAFAGKTVKCPKCSAPIQIPAPPHVGTLGDDSLSDLLDDVLPDADSSGGTKLRPRLTPRPTATPTVAPQGGGLATVSLGLRLVCLGLALRVAGTVLGWVSPSGASAALMASALIGATGAFLCLAAAKKLQATGIVIASLVTYLLGPIAGLVTLIGPVGMIGVMGASSIARIAIDLSLTVSTILFLNFLQRVGTEVRRKDLAQEAENLASMVWMLLGVTVLLMFLPLLMLRILLFPALLLYLIVGLYVVIRYGQLLLRLSAAVSSRLST